MTKKILLLKIICFALVFNFLTPAAFADSLSGSAKNRELITKAYEYQVKPGTKEWKEFSSKKQKIDACKIPESALTNMSTQALVETIMNYPLLVDIVAFNTNQEGFAAVYREFNGLQELTKRSDAISELERYKNRINSLKTEDTKAIAQGVYVDILIEGINANKQSIITPQYSDSYVTTPRGTRVSTYYDATWDDWGITLMQAGAIQGDLEITYPNATVLRSENPSYNCHSYAWYSTSSTNKHWMSDPSAYMEDLSYTSIGAVVGCKVYYGEADHSGIVTYVGAGSGPNINVRSKWGLYGLFEHNIVDCPYTEGSYSCTFWK